MRRLFANFGYKLLAVAIALFLWAVAHGSSPIERGFDIPVVLSGVPDDLVVTGHSVDMMNLRVMGTRAALRNLSPAALEYVVEVAGAKPGVAAFELDISRLELPRGARIVSHSPSRIELTFEPRASRAVRVRPDITGEPAEGFVLGAVDVVPGRVQITGARAAVLRLAEVVTETIDVSGADAPLEREVRISLGGDQIWLENPKPVRVRVGIQPLAAPSGTPPTG
jgi:YbbR domain-containing protein